MVATMIKYIQIAALLAAIFAYLLGVVGISRVSAFTEFAQVYRDTSAQVFSGGSFTKVDFNAERYDGDENFDLSTDRYTAPADGYYQFQAGLRPGLDPATDMAAEYRLNGTAVTQSRYDPGITNAFFPYQLDDIIYMEQGDYVELWVIFVDDAGYLDYAPSADRTYLNAYRLDGLSGGLSAGDLEPFWYAFGALLFFAGFMTVLYLLNLYRRV